MGKTQQTAYLGEVYFNDLKIFGKPGSQNSFTVVTDGFDLNDKKLSVDNFDVDVYFKNCTVGQKKFSNYCENCTIGFYNLKAGDECQKCVDGAVCLGENKIYTKAGYWRRHNHTDQVFKCFNEDACLGDMDSLQCSEGYEGNLCQVCSQGYSNGNENSCSKCLDYDENVAKIIGVIFIIGIFLIYQSYSTLESAYKERSITSIYLKILVNYLQIVSLTIEFELDWPKLAKKMFSAQRKASSGSEQFLSFDCFISGYLNPFFGKVFILTIVPLFCFILSLIFWVIKYLKTKPDLIKEKFIGTVIVQFFFFYPYIIRLNFLTFYCTKLDNDDYYLNSYMNIKCWESSHLIFTLAVVIPSIILVCFSAPLTMLLAISKNKRKLDEVGERLKYGFLYNGYKERFYYWEFIIILRKLFIILFFVFISRVSIPIQALCTFIVILLSFLLQLKFEPYSIYQLNILELLSILVSAVTIYSGIFFLTKDLSENAKLIIFVLMLLSNISFMTFWFYLTFPIFITKVNAVFKTCKNKFRRKVNSSVFKIHPIEQNVDIEVTGVKECAETSPYLRHNSVINSNE